MFKLLSLLSDFDIYDQTVIYPVVFNLDSPGFDWTIKVVSGTELVYWGVRVDKAEWVVIEFNCCLIGAPLSSQRERYNQGDDGDDYYYYYYYCVFEYEVYAYDIYYDKSYIFVYVDDEDWLRFGY